jgi:uncharacterized repeat protein (TIGR01451 family)
LYTDCVSICYRLTLLGKHLIAGLIAVFVINVSANAEDVILRHSFAGNISFELTGNTLRDSNNTCTAIFGGESSGSITLLNNSSIKAAYLYWSGSGAVDNTVILNGQSITSQTDYTEIFDGRTYFSSKADVTNIVSTTSATYRVSGLQFDGSNSYCATEGAYAGWALVIIFEHPGEALRVINVFDGFKSFWGSQFELIPNNFVIAPNPDIKKGKHAHITWEGDASNSQSRNNFTESLTFEGNNLTGIGNPSNNQFNGYSNVNSSINTSGVDIDEYQIGNFLSAGDTSVNTRYSSGQDAVFLTAEIISVPNEPVADLLIQQSGPANIIRGEENTFNFTVTNNGPNTAPQNSEFSLNIPQGFSYVNQTGNNWNCTTNNDDLSCIYNNQILSFTNSSTLSLTFIVDKTAGANDSINLTGFISGLLFDNILSNNSDQKSYLLKATDLTTSVKSVIDLNGGNVNAGDTLRYTISINENAGYGANNVSLTDHIDAVFSNYQVVSLPLNVTDNSLAAPNGNSNAGVVQIDDIFIAANSSEEIVIDATLSASLSSGSTIDNSALLSSIAFDDVTVTAQTLYTAQPIQSASGNKLLYLNSVRNVNRTSQIMRRNRPTGQDYRNIGRNNKDGIWTLNPEFQSTFEFSSDTINFNLCLQSNQNNNIQHGAQVQLLHNTTVIADSGRLNITLPNQNETPIQLPLSLTLSQTPIIPAGDTLIFRLVNITGEGGIRVYSKVGSDFCYVSIPAKTVINVDSIAVIDNSNNTVNEISAGSTVSIRSVVSDPFGSFDITSADLTATDPDGNTVFSAQTMSVFNDSGAATKTFNFDYVIPSTAKEGYWKFSVRAKEGEENTIDHTSDFMLLVNQALPNISLEKSVVVFSDPIHGINSANNFSKALPGSILTYTIKAENTGPGIAENNSIWISDAIPDKTFMLVKDFNNISGQGPLIEQPVNPTSGLSYQFITLNSNSDDIEFSENNGLDFDYSPTADSEGIDQNITHFRVNPNGIFQAPAAGESTNQFSIKFRVKLQ